MHPLYEKQNCTKQEKMKITTPVRHTIRFRRWSRKAYAAFASIGHCVTIGNLPKSVADSSLSKQKATGSAGHTSCGKDSAWEGVTEGKETDIGIPIGSSTTLTCGVVEPQIILQTLFGSSIIRPCVHTDGEETYILKQRNYISTDYQKTASPLTKSLYPDNSCFFFYQRT